MSALSREETERRMAGIQPEDWKAIGCDFAAVVEDLRRAMEQHERASKPKRPTMSDEEFRDACHRLGWGVRRSELGSLLPVIPEPKPSLWSRLRSWLERARPWWVWP